MRIHLGCAAALAVALAACSGDNGAAGMDGDSGEPGTTGANGKNGENGATGAKGAPGAKGDDGADGAKGDDGATGAKGSTGAKGADGADGQDGDDIILSETARLGLSISQVPVDTEGLKGDEIESVGRGAYIVNALSDCIGCHSSEGFLDGNNEFPFPPVGWDSTSKAPCTPGAANCEATVVYSRNLTPDPNAGLKLTEDQFVTVLRTGRDFKDASGATSLIVMPWQQLRWMTERDMRDIYHYLKHIPAADTVPQADKKPKIAPAKLPYSDDTTGDPIDIPQFTDGANDRPLPAAVDFEATPPKPTAAAGELFDTNNVLRGLAISPLNDDSDVEDLSASDQALYGRGSYIVNGPGLCNECHTPLGRNANGTVRTATFLAGGQAFGIPVAFQSMVGQVRSMSGNLTGEDHGFTLAYSMFLNTLVSGMSFTKATPHLLGAPMPFDTLRNMTNADKEAVYTYMTTIQKLGLVPGDTEHQAPARYCTPATVGADCQGGETCEAITVSGDDTHECAGGGCTSDADCGACQKCDTGNTNKCLKEDAASLCVQTSF